MPGGGLRGASLPELVVVLLVLAILSGLALPRLSSYLDQLLVRSTLTRFTADFYLARGLAARSGDRVRLRMLEEPGGCIDRYQLISATDSILLTRRLAVERGLCLTIAGAPTISINSRGMPAGAARTLRATRGAQADSLRLSMVGRVLRFNAVTLAWFARRTANNIPDAKGLPASHGGLIEHKASVYAGSGRGMLLSPAAGHGQPISAPRDSGFYAHRAPHRVRHLRDPRGAHGACDLRGMPRPEHAGALTVVSGGRSAVLEISIAGRVCRDR